MKINMNDVVKVKLTDKGIAVLKQKHELLNSIIKKQNGKGIGEFKLKIDENGYYSTQLWMLFEDFGSEINAGCEVPFENNMILVGD